MLLQAKVKILCSMISEWNSQTSECKRKGLLSLPGVFSPALLCARLAVSLRASLLHSHTARMRSYLLFSQVLFLSVSIADSTTASEIEQEETRPLFSESEVRAITSMGPWPATPPPDPGNEFSGVSWAETLGEELFFSEALSGNGQLSCASCHIPELGFSDGLAVGVGIDKHVRNSQGLFNAGFQLSLIHI